MPSYRYLKDIDPEDRPAGPVQYTKKQLRANWWHYHWYWVAAAVLAAGLLLYWVIGAFTATKADVTFGFIASHDLPEEMADMITEALQDAGLVLDENEDGKTVAEFEVFTLDGGQGDAGDDSAPAVQDPYTGVAGMVSLTTALGNSEPVLCILEPAMVEPCQRQYGLLGSLEDGSLPADAADIDAYTIAWKDIPALAGIDLTVDYYGEEMDGQVLLEEYRVGLRALEGNLEEIEGGRESWERAHALLQRMGV